MFFLHIHNKELTGSKWNFDDACVFYSIAVWNTNDGKELVDVLLAGNLLTRNIFTIDVLKTSIPKLKEAGLIYIEEMLFFLTAKGKELFENVSETTNRSQRLIRAIQKELSNLTGNFNSTGKYLEALTTDIWEKAEHECTERSSKIFK